MTVTPRFFPKAGRWPSRFKHEEPHLVLLAGADKLRKHEGSISKRPANSQFERFAKVLDHTIPEVRYRLRSSLRAPLVWFRHRGLGPGNPHTFLASYQRSGSTWLRFLLCEVLTGYDADYRNVKYTIPDVRHYRIGSPTAGGGRLIKTHEPYRREYRKAIYLVRDPRDVAVSLHDYTRPHQSMNSFVECFVRGKAAPHGCWRHNVWTWLQSPLAEKANLLVVKYETLRGDTESTLAKILEFLGAAAAPEAIRNAIANNNVASMRAKEDRARAAGLEVSGERLRSAVPGRSIHRGTIGGWRRRLTSAQSALIEDHAGELLAALSYPRSAVLCPGAGNAGHPRVLADSVRTNGGFVGDARNPQHHGSER